jgi:hypothetical protein
LNGNGFHQETNNKELGRKYLFNDEVVRLHNSEKKYWAQSKFLLAHKRKLKPGTLEPKPSSINKEG